MAEDKGLTRKQRAECTRQALLDKGREILRHVDSFDDFVVEDITDACGVSKGTFYLYFKSKGAFFYDLKLAEAREANERLTSILLNGGQSASNDILEFVRQWLRIIQKYDKQLGRYWVSYLLDEELRNSKSPLGINWYTYPDLISRRLKEGVQNGEFVGQTPTTRVAHEIMAVIHGFDVVSVITEKGFDSNDCADEAADIVESGILCQWRK